MDSIVLAGGRSTGELLRRTGEPIKALIKLRGKTLLEYVLDALKSCKYIDRIVIVGPRELSRFSGQVYKFIVEGKDFIANIELGIAALKSSAPVLLIASDLPLVTAQAIDAFIEAAINSNSMLAIPSIDMRICKKCYPKFRCLYARFKEGGFKNGNLAVIQPELFFGAKAKVEATFKGRKNLLALACILGFGFFLRFLLGFFIPYFRPSIKELETKASESFQATSTAPQIPFPELGVDIDDYEDLKAVEEYLR